MSVDSGSTLGGPRETFLVTFQATVEECQWLEELFSLPAASPGCFAQCWWINFPFSSSILIFVSWGWFFTNSFSCVSWQSCFHRENADEFLALKGAWLYGPLLSCIRKQTSHFSNFPLHWRLPGLYCLNQIKLKLSPVWDILPGSKKQKEEVLRSLLCFQWTHNKEWCTACWHSRLWFDWHKGGSENSIKSKWALLGLK